MLKTIYILLCLFAVQFYSSAQIAIKIELDKSSWLSIKGFTNVISFKIIHNGEKLQGKTFSVEVTQLGDKFEFSKNKLAVQVNDFNSDNKMALRDFKKLIKSDIYPTMEAQLNSVISSSQIEQKKRNKGIALVNITITGISRTYKIPVSSIKKDDYLTIEGGKKISIRDFELEPPTEMLGLIKVSEWINIDFHMVCKLKYSSVLSERL